VSRIVIRGEYARLIQPFISREETRYYLNGFHVEPHPEKGVLIVATDGHKLGCFYDELGTADAPQIVKLEKWLLPLLRAPKKRAAEAMERYLVVTWPDDGKFFVSQSRASVYDGSPDEPVTRFVAAQGEALVDGTFPNWRKVVPKIPEKFGSPNFNADYLTAAAISERGKDKCRQLRVLGAGDADPALVFNGRDDFFGVVMPMRHSRYRAEEVKMPKWWPAPPTE
jgi:DNA polymerase-3 subunit beta